MFSFYSEREKIIETWKTYAALWSAYPKVIWQIGLRGIADRPMWMADPGVPQSNEERGNIISEAMAVQAQIVDSLSGNKPHYLSTTLWAEGSGLNQEGHLSFPKNTTVVFADNNPGWKWQRDFYDTKRDTSNTYGVYYHHQLWASGPHLVQAVPPEKTYAMFQEAVENAASYYAILNISNLREFIFGVEASAEMLYDMSSFSLSDFKEGWFTKHFGDKASEVSELYDGFFKSFQTDKTRNVPLLLDGQTRQYGLKLIDRLKMQIENPAEYEKVLTSEKDLTIEQSWGASHLGDMHVANQLSPAALLPVVEKQAEHFASMSKPLYDLNKEMQGDQLRFLNVNLYAQQITMLALNKWLIGLINARLAYDEMKIEQSALYVQEAAHALDELNEAEEFITSGEKWKFWYRGERKMNLNGMKNETLELLTLLENKKEGGKK